MSLQGKKIIVAVTGSIAAYKTPELVRQLIKSGAEVRVLMTAEAAEFVSPLSLATVSKHEVYSNVSEGAQWHNHVALGLWADAVVIAPCTANTLAKLAHGICDTMVGAVYLSARCAVFIAPAMDEDMWRHPATQHNIDLVKSFGNTVLPVGNGELASGLIGPGRMMEPAQIRDYLTQYFQNTNTMAGVQAMVTAGPTYERLDPVRFIGNFSTGKMGIAIADELASKGATVHLILGPSQYRPENNNVKVYPVESADDMFEISNKLFPNMDVAVMSAAVADYKPNNQAGQKIKSNQGALMIELTKNKDILASLGAIKQPQQILVGFALETNNALEYAQQKLIKKNADLMVMNSLQDDGAGFGHDTNKVTLISKNGRVEALPLQSKKQVAATIIEKIEQLQHEQKVVV